MKNILELYKTYKEENDKLTKQLKDNASDVLTNERKTYYENQGIDSLKFVYYYVLLFLYVICVIIYAFNALLYTSQINWKIRLSIFILLLLLPFASPYLLTFCINIIYKIFELLPKKTDLHV